MERRNNAPIPPWLVWLVIIVVLVMWLGSTTYSALNPEWPVPAAVNGAASAVVLAVMSYITLRRNGNGKSNGGS